MSTCCDTTDEPVPLKGTLTVALAGNPNSGKTTIFNALTGLRQKVANYPGVTVEKKTGRCKLPNGSWADVIDLPGTYSLISRSPDEHIAMEVLRGLRADTKAPDLVVVVVDASNLQRNLYLVSQVIELGRPMVIALNMMDVAQRRGLHVSPDALEKELGVRVIPIVGHKRRGVDDLKAAILNARVAPLPHWPLPQSIRDELLLVGGGLAKIDADAGSRSLEEITPTASLSRGKKAVYPSDHSEIRTPQSEIPRAWICTPDMSRRIDRYEAVAERLLIGDRAPDMAKLAAREPVKSLLDAALARLKTLGIDPMQADVEAHYRWIEDVSGRATAMRASDRSGITSNTLNYARPERNFTQQLDAVLIHKVWGLIIFAVVMAALFVTVFWVADPLMAGISTAVDAAGAWVTGKLPEGPIHDLVNDGIFKGVGAVVVFVPQIALLFLFLAIMEDSGYLARAAFLMDRLLSKVGLHGKSFIPLLSSFACAIPGIMATRTIENRKDRLATIFIAPFMSCSARLPVYFLLIGLFFAKSSALLRGGMMLSLYALGVIAAVGTAWLFKRSLLKGPTPAFILEMPSYKLPQVSQIARQVWTNTCQFLTKAGTTIFCLSVILWAMTYYPRLPDAEASKIHVNTRAAIARMDPTLPEPKYTPYSWDSEAVERWEEQISGPAIASEQLRYSLAGRMGHFLEPAIRPLGYDWKIGVGLVGSFAAREVFVSTMAIVYNAGSEDDTQDLSTAMRSDRHPDGTPVWTPLVAISLLVWFVLAMQCMSTVAIVKRETGGWRWPLFMILYMNGLAYVICLVVYQVGRHFS